MGHILHRSGRWDPPCWTLAACLRGLGHSEGLAAPCSAFLPQLFLCTLHFFSSLCGHTPPRSLPNKSNTPVSCRWSHRDVLGNRFLLCPSRNLVNPFLGNSAVRSCFISEWTGKKCNYIRSLTSDKKSLSAKHLFPVAEMMQRNSCQSPKGCSKARDVTKTDWSSLNKLVIFFRNSCIRIRFYLSSVELVCGTV